MRIQRFRAEKGDISELEWLRIVTDVLARPGDVVEVGQQLLVIESADLGSAKSDYAKAVADVDRSDAALRLARELFEVKAIAQNEIREAENDPDLAGPSGGLCAVCGPPGAAPHPEARRRVGVQPATGSEGACRACRVKAPTGPMDS